MVVVEGRIRGKQRPRVVRGHAFTPKETVQYENWIRLCYQEQDGRYIEGCIKLVMYIYHEIPKSYTKKRIQAIREGKELPVKKVDIDNCLKVYADSLNGIAYKDDVQIVEVIVKKRYAIDSIERVEFELLEI